jgi:hypothetical protein
MPAPVDTVGELSSVSGASSFSSIRRAIASRLRTLLARWHLCPPEGLPATGPVITVSELRSDQLELLAWLRRNAPSLAELYEGAVLMLQTRPPGHVRLVAHAVREIRNRLPDYVSKVESGGPLDYKSRIDGIVDVWRRAGLLPSDFATSGLPTIDTTTPVPKTAATAVLKLLRDHESARAKPSQTARRLFTSAAPENLEALDALEPVIQHWLDVTQWFMKRAHDDRRCDADCPRQDLEHQFMLFEKTLMAIVRQFYTTVDELDQILEDANS